MKKAILVLLCVLMIFSISCKQETPKEETPKEEEKLTVEDYYPLFSDKEYIYTGEGNEYASYKIYPDYLDEKSSKIQIRTNNGGTEVVQVLQISEGNLSRIINKGEAYYRDNLLEHAAIEDTVILLKEPLKEGSNWTLPDGRTRRITDTKVNLTTSLGEYKDVIEVTVESEGGIAKEYYAKGVGLIKTVYESDESIITSTLSEIKENANYEKVLQVFYVDQDEKIHTKDVIITFKTNDITRLKIEESLKELADGMALPLISTNTKINTLYLGDDNIAYVDFSPELITEINAGAMFESLILQSITNTVGNYYGVERVYLTVGGKPYESGHIALEKGETLEECSR